MDVDTIISQIATLGMGDDDPDTTEQTTILGYLQNYYNELYGKIIDLSVVDLHIEEDVIITAGAGTVANDVFKATFCKNKTNGDSKMEQTDIVSLEKEVRDPAISGVASEFYLHGDFSTLKGYPVEASATYTLGYYPFPTTLALGGAESTIQIPSPYHSVLVWGGLAYMIFDERDKAFQISAAVAQTSAERLEGNLSAFLRRLPHKKRKVRQWR